MARYALYKLRHGRAQVLCSVKTTGRARRRERARRRFVFSMILSAWLTTGTSLVCISMITRRCLHVSQTDDGKLFFVHGRFTSSSSHPKAAINIAGLCPYNIRLLPLLNNRKEPIRRANTFENQRVTSRIIWQPFSTSIRGRLAKRQVRVRGVAGRLGGIAICGALSPCALRRTLSTPSGQQGSNCIHTSRSLPADRPVARGAVSLKRTRLRPS